MIQSGENEHYNNNNNNNTLIPTCTVYVRHETLIL